MSAPSRLSPGTGNVNSMATNADGERFVIFFEALADYSGATISLVVILYASGLIEIRYYSINCNPIPTYDDDSFATDRVSAGLQEGNSPYSHITHSGFSQISLEDTLSDWQGMVLSFRGSS